MSTKDYLLLEEALRACRPSDPNQQDLYLYILYSLADALKKENPRFDKEKFLKAVDV